MWVRAGGCVSAGTPWILRCVLACLVWQKWDQLKCCSAKLLVMAGVQGVRANRVRQQPPTTIWTFTVNTAQVVTKSENSAATRTFSSLNKKNVKQDFKLWLTFKTLLLFASQHDVSNRTEGEKMMVSSVTSQCFFYSWSSGGCCALWCFIGMQQSDLLNTDIMNQIRWHAQKKDLGPKQTWLSEVFECRSVSDCSDWPH